MFSFLKRSPARPHLPHILIPQEALAEGADPHDAMMGVIDYVNAALHGALYLVGEFPQDAFDLYAADYYVCQINNGGHAQYIGNDRFVTGRESTASEALRGLKLVGYAPFVDCLSAMERWVADNARAAARQNGFTTRDPALDALDSRFYKAGSDGFYAAVRQWLSSSPLVRALPRAEYDHEMAALKPRNTRYAARMRVNMINALDSGLTTDTVALYRACASGALYQDRQYEVQRVAGGHPSRHPDADRPDFDFAAAESQFWDLETNARPVSGCIHQGQVKIWLKNPETGKYETLFSKPMDEAQALMDFAGQQKPARFAVDMLNDLTPDDPPAFLSFGASQPSGAGAEDAPMIYGVTSRRGVQYLLFVTDTRAGLASFPESKLLARIDGRGFARLAAEDLSKLT